MKYELNIFCNNNIKNFLTSLLSEYELTIMKLGVMKDNLQTSQANIIIISDSDSDIDFRDFGSLSDSYLVITNLKNLNLS